MQGETFMRDDEGTTSGNYSVGGSHAQTILIVCSLLYMVNYMDRQVLSVILEPMKKALELSDTQAGTIQTVFLLSIALFSFPAAFLVDRWSRRKAISVMAIIWSVFTFLTGLGRSFSGVLLPRTMVGVGEAGFASGGTAMITAAYPYQARGKVMGVFNAFIPLGAGLGMILGGYISVQSGNWRTPFFIFAIPGIILAILALFLRDYKTVEAVDATGRQVGLFSLALSLFKVPTLRWLYIGNAMQQIMAFSFLVWTPAFLMRARDISEAKAGLIVGAVSLMAILGAPLGGFIADTWQGKYQRARMMVPTVAMFASAVLVSLSYASNFEGVGLFSGILFGIIIMIGVPALSATTQEVVVPGLKGMSWGMNVLCQYLLGGGWAPLVVGAVSDALGGGANGLRTALIITAASGLAAGVCYWISSKYYPADMERVRYMALEAE
jgi:MFS family permease